MRGETIGEMPGSPHDEIRGVIARVRARWRRMRALEATFTAALLAAFVVAAGLAMSSWAARTPLGLAVVGAATVALAVGAVAWRVRRLGPRPSDIRVARFIEERVPELDDRLASAVDVLGATRDSPSLAGPMLADAADRLAGVDVDPVVPDRTLTRAGLKAAAAVAALAAVLFVGRDRAGQAYDAAALTLFPAHVTLDVTPGDARVRTGDAFTVDVTIGGSRAPIVPRIEIDVADRRDAAPMVGTAGVADARFRYSLGHVTSSFTYRVTAPGGLSAGPFTVAVVAPPRVDRIDVEYAYPKTLGLAPRTEEDGGDIYAPEGTGIRVHVHTDRPADSGAMALVEGGSVALAPVSATELVGTFTVQHNDSYRVALADADGLSSDGDIEYFIRALEDRPPEVRVTEPAGDRNVTRLEEVDVAARADDDYGVDRLELVYSVKAGPERVLPIEIPGHATSVNGRQTIYLEGLDVAPGDLVSYYVRARDVARGKRSSEARSDIFFLQVRPFEQEFSLAQSQGVTSGAAQALGDLVNQQKEVIAATWKLDRRTATTAGARSEEDVHAVAHAEDALKTRVEQASAAFGESTMRNPRRSSLFGPEPRVPIQPRPEQAAMTAASAAMGQAVTALNRVSTTDALPQEMEALNQLLKAQADAKPIQIATAPGTGGRGNSNYDLSSLFDRELQRSQQTNYETPGADQARGEPDEASKLIDAIHQLAERQDELVKRQRDLSEARLTDAERRRELEKLTREQSELRQQAEELSRQPSGSQPQAGAGRSGQGASGSQTERMRDAAQAMQAAANELRRENPGGAGASGSRARDDLRELERQLRGAQPEDGRRAMGDAQLEARQIAEAERRLANELEALGGSSGRSGREPQQDDQGGADGRRRLAAEQSRLADRADALGKSLGQQGAGATTTPSGDADADRTREAMADAARDLQTGRVAERMRQASSAVASGAAAADGSRDRQTAEEQRQLARTLEGAADRMATAAAPGDEASRRQAGQMAEMRSVRERLDEVSREIARLGQEGRSDAAGQLERLRDEYGRQLERAEQLLNEVRREDPTLEGVVGFTFEGQGMTLSAPGTEAFKQDFARWDDLRRQAAAALERAESSMSTALQARESGERLAVGVDDTPPADYQSQVDAYFKAIAQGTDRR